MYLRAESRRYTFYPLFLNVASDVGSECKSGVKAILRTQLRHVLGQRIYVIKNRFEHLDLGRQQQNGQRRMTCLL